MSEARDEAILMVTFIVEDSMRHADITDETEEAIKEIITFIEHPEFWNVLDNLKGSKNVGISEDYAESAE